VIAKVVACAAVVGATVWTAGPVGADPNYYELLSCHCQERAAPGSAALKQEMSEGITDGLAFRALTGSQR